MEPYIGPTCQGSSIFRNAWRIPPNSLSTQACSQENNTGVMFTPKAVATLKLHEFIRFFYISSQITGSVSNSSPKWERARTPCWSWWRINLARLEMRQIFRPLGPLRGKKWDKCWVSLSRAKPSQDKFMEPGCRFGGCKKICQEISINFKAIITPSQPTSNSWIPVATGSNSSNEAVPLSSCTTCWKCSEV